MRPIRKSRVRAKTIDRRQILWLSFFLFLSFALILQVNAQSRKTVIDFEDELVEGVNKRPLDSLSAISEKNKKRKKLHLYLKRAGFRTETNETLREIGYAK